jgi:hypothetical protein
MALTQIIPGGGDSEDNVKGLLRTEYKLLCMANSIKKHFDQWAKECHATKIPSEFNNFRASFIITDIAVSEFSFNFDHSIFGCLHSLRESGGRHLPYKHFIAMPLLPCDKLDAGIQKFTGNDDIGDATNDITRAIHAFAHFSLIYTKHTHLFCDLQGLLIRVLYGLD